MIVGPLSLDTGMMSQLLHDADGNVRGAMICWAVALSALIIFRVPRQVVLACLFVAAATVGLAALVIEAPVNALGTPANASPSHVAKENAMAPRSDVSNRD